jgi:DNA polymerase-1
MPNPALIGTYPLPGLTGATLTAGVEHVRLKLQEIFRNGPVPLAEDIETRGLGLDAQYIKCTTLATTYAAVILNPREQADRAELLRAQEYASGLIMHKANFDAPNLAINGLFPFHLVDKITDTVLWKRLALPGDRKMPDLDALAKHFLGIDGGRIIDLFRSLGYKTKREGFLKLDIDSPAYLFGAASDAVVTARIEPVLRQAALDRQLNHPFQPPIGLSRYEAEQMMAERQEHNRWAIETQIDGLRADFDYLDRFRAKNQRSMDEATAYLGSLGITNGNQLAAFLEQIGAIPPGYPRTPKTKVPSTKADDLKLLNHPLAQVYGELKLKEHLDGYLQKCVDMADANGRIHPATDVLKAAHGRDAMADPPLHQFPGEARGIIWERLTSTDYAQQEPRIAMNLAGDIEPLIPYETAGVKIYQPIATFADIHIDMAKIVVLAGLYGRGLGEMSAQLKLPPDPWIEEWTTNSGRVIEAHWGYDAAKEVQAAVFSAIPATERFMNAGKQIARDHELAWTVAGRIVPIPSGFYKGRYSVQAHKWINYNVSGSANDEISGVIVTARRMGLGRGVKFGMHDELLTRPEIAHDIRRLMETPSERFCRLAGRVPVIRTDTKVLGERWAKA